MERQRNLNSSLKAGKNQFEEPRKLNEESTPARRGFMKVQAAFSLFIFDLHTSIYIYLRGFTFLGVVHFEKTYRLNGDLAAEVKDEDVSNKKFGKVGSWEGISEAETNSMSTLVSLRLGRGREEDNRQTSQEANHSSGFTQLTIPEDEVLDSEHEEMFDLYVLLKLVTTPIMFLMLYLFYYCILKSIMYASRGESSDSEDLYFCKSQSMLRSF